MLWASLFSSPVDAMVVLVDAPVVGGDAAAVSDVGAAASGESLESLVKGKKTLQFVVIWSGFH